MVFWVLRFGILGFEVWVWDWHRVEISNAVQATTIEDVEVAWASAKLVTQHTEGHSPLLMIACALFVFLLRCRTSHALEFGEEQRPYSPQS